MRKYLVYMLASMIGTFTGCHEKASSQSGERRAYQKDQFGAYWYAGKAELVSYKLDQARYGENHEGSAVLIFVTEPFSQKKQVKLDNAEAAGDDKVTVLKLNFTKKFVTGIYPYSMMSSVFTPVERAQFPHSLKATMTSQEWCGQVFSQMNLRGNEFDVHSYSYFEQEGDTHFELKNVLLEDEVWNIIRLEPDHLPTGKIEIIPGLFHTRLHHVKQQVMEATAIRDEKKDQITYTLTYPEQRTLAITFEKNFPHKILGWTEKFKGRDGEMMTTTATFDKMLHTDYWTKNKKEFHYLRDSLGLD